MLNTEEIKEINNLINDGSALIAITKDYCEFHTETQIQIALECSQKFLYEAMERLSRLW